MAAARLIAGVHDDDAEAAARVMASSETAMASPVIAIVGDRFNYGTVVQTHAIARTCARQAATLVDCIDGLGRFGVSLRRCSQAQF